MDSQHDHMNSKLIEGEIID